MSTKVLHSLELPNLPDDLDGNPDSGWVRVYIEDGKVKRKLSDGTVQVLAFEYSPSSANETQPVFTYEQELLARIDYNSGSYKIFTYTAGLLTQLDYTKDSVTYRKVFNYDANSNLVSITESVV